MLGPSESRTNFIGRTADQTKVETRTQADKSLQRQSYRHEAGSGEKTPKKQNTIEDKTADAEEVNPDT
jgi:hypothetical protein